MGRAPESAKTIRRWSAAAFAAASAAVGAAIVGIVWFDSISTRRELVGLLRDQAAALRETVAAAARSNRAAGAVAEAQLAARLLETARFLRELDRRGALTEAAAGEVAEQSGLFRINVVPAGGHHGERGRGLGPQHGRGGGFGFRGGGGALARRLLEGGEDEVVSDVHTSPRGGGERLAAGVRRQGGGAIIVNVDAAAVAELQRPASLSALLEDVTRSADEIAYTVLEAGGERQPHGQAPLPSAATEGEGVAAERELEVAGRPVLEFSGPVPLGPGETGVLRLGMRLDGVRAAERRMALRLGASITAAALLVALTFGTLRWRERYGALSAKHARAQEALRRRDRLAAVGELAATVAHEVRNPLNAIGMSVQRVQREFLEAAAPLDDEARGELRELLSVMAAETARINLSVQQLLDYARPPRLDPRPADLAALVGSLVESRQALAESRGIRLSVEAAAAATARVDADQLRQAVDNLLRNAFEATPPGGRVEVRARSTPREHVIEVADTGQGIPSDQLDRVFDLYFTTKPEGTGVGLAVTHQIVTAHGGTVEVDSRAGAGTRVTVRLPVDAEAAAHA